VYTVYTPRETAKCDGASPFEISRHRCGLFVEGRVELLQATALYVLFDIDSGQ
jgi:hypothetical protein